MSQAPIPERWREWQETKRKLSVPHYVLRNAIAEIADLEVRGRINAETLDELRDTIETLEAQNRQLREVLDMMLSSAHPNERDHPAMFCAWKEARAALAATD